MGDINLVSVLQFIASHGGSVENHKIVTHFKDFLNHPTNKVANREKFKDYVTEVANIKVHNGEKVLVLKKKYTQTMENLASALVTPPQDSPTEPSAGGEMDVDSPDGGMMSKTKTDEKMDVTLHTTDRVTMSAGKLDDSVSMSSAAGSAASLTSSESQSSLTSGVSSMVEDSSFTSVKDKIKNLNKNVSDSDVTRIRPAGSGGMGKKGHKHVVGEDDASEPYVTLTADQKFWLGVCACSDYHEMNRLLSKNPGLAKLRDLTNGYTGLHYAAKSGKSEVIKLLANKPGVSVNQRSHGGYTALHLAALQGHEHILELLVQTYKADANLRDYSGKKAKQYLKNSATSKMQRKRIQSVNSPSFSNALNLLTAHPGSDQDKRKSGIFMSVSDSALVNKANTP